MINDFLLFLVHRRVFVGACLGGLLCPTRSLSGYCSNHSGHRHVTPYVGHTGWCGVLQQLVVDGRDHSYHMDSWPPGDGVIGVVDVKIAEFRDIEWISADWVLNRAGGTWLIFVEFVEK